MACIPIRRLPVTRPYYWVTTMMRPCHVSIMWNLFFIMIMKKTKRAPVNRIVHTSHPVITSAMSNKKAVFCSIFQTPCHFLTQNVYGVKKDTPTNTDSRTIFSPRVATNSFTEPVKPSTPGGWNPPKDSTLIVKPWISDYLTMTSPKPSPKEVSASIV